MWHAMEYITIWITELKQEFSENNRQSSPEDNNYFKDSIHQKYDWTAIKKLCYKMNGFVTWNIKLKYEFPTSSAFRFITNIQVSQKQVKFRGHKAQYYGLVKKSIPVQYESHISPGLKVIAKVTVFQKVGQYSRSRSHGKTMWYHVWKVY